MVLLLASSCMVNNGWGNRLNERGLVAYSERILMEQVFMYADAMQNAWLLNEFEKADEAGRKDEMFDLIRDNIRHIDDKTIVISYRQYNIEGDLSVEGTAWKVADGITITKTDTGWSLSAENNLLEMDFLRNSSGTWVVDVLGETEDDEGYMSRYMSGAGGLVLDTIKDGRYWRQEYYGEFVVDIYRDNRKIDYCRIYRDTDGTEVAETSR